MIFIYGVKASAVFDKGGFAATMKNTLMRETVNILRRSTLVRVYEY